MLTQRPSLTRGLETLRCEGSPSQPFLHNGCEGHPSQRSAHADERAASIADSLHSVSRDREACLGAGRRGGEVARVGRQAPALLHKRAVQAHRGPQVVCTTAQLRPCPMSGTQHYVRQVQTYNSVSSGKKVVNFISGRA